MIQINIWTVLIAVGVTAVATRRNGAIGARKRRKKPKGGMTASQAGSLVALRAPHLIGFAGALAFSIPWL